MPLAATRQGAVFQGGANRSQARCTRLVHSNRARHRSGAAPVDVNGSTASGIEMNEKLLSELSSRLAEAAKGNPAKDLEKNFRGLLSSALTRLDLVSREEYDVQAEVLARTREKLAALEARLAAIEARSGAAGSES